MATQLYRPRCLGLMVRPIGRFASNFNRPSPPSLPPGQQREFEELQRAAQNPISSVIPNNFATTDEAQFPLHPDTLQPVKPEFEGDIHPATGERGGPKREPVGKWGPDSEGDWSFKGRVSDF